MKNEEESGNTKREEGGREGNTETARGYLSNYGIKSLQGNEMVR